MTIPDSHHYAPVSFPGADGDNAPLGEHFFATPTETPASEAQPYLEVVAPSTLPEGYTFEAEANGHSFTVKVPVGGVEEGQKFSVPFPAGANDYSGAAIPRASVPVGHWKDGMCDCCRHGPIHPAIWNALCCPMILVGQVMHRLKLTWLGNEGTIAQTTATFRILLYITIAYVTVERLLYFLASAGVDERGKLTDTFWALVFTRLFWIFCFAVFTIFLVAKTRARIRSKYSIPEKQCPGCEDFCCSFWCNCCTVAQMARHTADYGTYAGLCCSETGTPPHAPSIV
mmetsp:Transcript_21926/g.34458  ORF Transcript_21926/g.34458 Transcript_21926/m.34458 type:complete len:285 (+) Transcript_21926:103-957(+)|eukprot:CAMPEP_0201609636 /NCGR_PEP_ID=MMETSP0492-20130828/14312_1 /ASSEMBLY_ACC=CAM_ASM_000837 /TAXON_ID=420259 /ORGANISM="Thalassiosira gravida, Strain GMp14c1" /LENGTH=284 /DNA_ID=CAMNT_0048075181 /DNA_START=93 /DNA_END=947 /DNA_ORIENTATION=-